MGGFVNLEYGFIIQSPAVIGQYNISGYIGSPVFPFDGIGDFHINLTNPINISCTIEFTSNNGYLQLGDRCFVTSRQINVRNAVLDFKGIVDHPLLDSELKFDILELIVDHVNIYSFSQSISDAVLTYVNSHLRQDFQVYWRQLCFCFDFKNFSLIRPKS